MEDGDQRRRGVVSNWYRKNGGRQIDEICTVKKMVNDGEKPKTVEEGKWEEDRDK